MPIEISLDADRQRVVARIYGRVTLEEIREAAGGVFGDPAMRPGFKVLSDHIGIEEALTTEAVHGLAGFLDANRPILRGVRWAVVTSRQASFGMMRMLAAYAESAVSIRVFLDPAEAEVWLDGSDDADEP